MPYADRELPNSCLEINNTWRSVTYMVCWAIVEAHEPERVVRQFGGTPFIPEMRDWGFNENHFKTSRRGKSKANWAIENRAYIQHWERRSEFVSNHYMEPLEDHVQVIRTRAYMEWYHRITITYITQPGRLPDVGMNTGAPSSTIQVSIVFYNFFILFMYVINYSSFICYRLRHWPVCITCRVILTHQTP